MTLVVFRWTKKDVKSHIFIGIGRNMSIEKVRFQQLRYILEEEFDNNRDKFARKLNISLSSLSKYVSNGKNRRDISDPTARRFEKRLGLKASALEQSRDANVYYVSVSFSGGHPCKFLESLRRYEMVKEASMQYGVADIFIKIEGSKQDCQELIFNNIRLFPGVTGTTTSQALNTSRWQRSQAEYYELTEKEELSSRLLQNYIDIKREDLYKELSDLDKGKKVIIHKYDINALTYEELLESAEETIKTSLLYNLYPRGWLEKDFLKSKDKIPSHIKRQILLFTRNPMTRKVESALLDFISILKNNPNIEVQVMDERDWIGNKNNRMPITLTIIDDSIVSILSGELQSFTLVYKNDLISDYSRLFDKNWNSAKNEGRF